MAADDRVAAGATTAPNPRVAIVAALGIECASLAAQRHATTAISVHQCGPGAERARGSASAAIAGGATALVSWGLAGALDAALAPGTVVLPRRLVRERGGFSETDSAWRARLTRELTPEFVLDDRDLLGAQEVLATPEAKALAGHATGAIAVDLESAAIAEVAERARVPFVALRVIVDTQADALPSDAARWIDERGARRMTAALDAAFSPSEWPTLWILAQRYRTARRVLSRLARHLVPNAFWAPAIRNDVGIADRIDR